MDAKELQPGYERVFTVTEYYDGPRQGIANFKGEPHFYDCVFDDARDDYSNLFRLTPVTPAAFKLAIEDWSIWERWESAFNTGKANRDFHPALPEDRARHDELKRLLESSLKTDMESCLCQEGHFDGSERVRWTSGADMPITNRDKQVKSEDKRTSARSLRHSSLEDSAGRTISKQHDQNACPVCNERIEKTAKGGRRKHACSKCGATLNKQLTCASCNTQRIWRGKKGAACLGCGAKVQVL